MSNWPCLYNRHVTCSWSVLFATAEHKADSPASERGAREEGREGEDDLRGEEERWGEKPRTNASSGAPELSWSASDDDSPSDNTVYRRKAQIKHCQMCDIKSCALHSFYLSDVSQGVCQRRSVSSHHLHVSLIVTTLFLKGTQ